MYNYTKIECLSRLENETMVRCMVGMFVSKINPTLDELTVVKTLVSEAMINAIIHGYENKENGRIFIELVLNDNELCITLQDEGVGIEDLNQAKVPLYTTKPELERSGMGITIMETLSDHFEIESIVGKGTKVSMTKIFRGHQ